MVKLGPRKLNRFAIRPAMMFASSPGIVSSVMSGDRLRNDWLRLGDDRVPGAGGQRRERGRPGKLAGELGQLDPQDRRVVLLAAHRVADDHGDALGIDVPAGPPGVDQGLARRGHRPLLAVIHLVADLGRQRQAPADRIPGEFTDPSADP